PAAFWTRSAGCRAERRGHARRLRRSSSGSAVRRRRLSKKGALLPEGGAAAAGHSMGHALVELGLPWCECNLSLEGLRRTLEAERESPNRTQYLALVRAELGQ